MRVFLYEFVTGGGWFFVDGTSPPEGSLLREGAAMLCAVAEDFSRLSEVKVVVLWDSRLPPPATGKTRIKTIGSAETHDAAFRQAAATADYSLVIAPEFDRHLARSSQMVIEAGGKLLSPDAKFVQLTSDKQFTADRLAVAGVRVPRGVPLAPGEILPPEFPYPAVLKPRDGAGSLDVRLIADRKQAKETPPPESPSRLEEFCPGTSASVAVLCSRPANVPLPAMRQNLSGDGRFTYLGGDNRLTIPMQERAQALATSALAALPPTLGYVGIDMVLGEADDSLDDVVIEVNPRLTTSYVGLRKLFHENLARAMLEAAAGKIPDLSPRDCEVEFSADGEVVVFGT